MPEVVTPSRSYSEFVCPTRKRALEVATMFGHFLIDNGCSPPVNPSQWFIFSIVKSGDKQWTVQIGHSQVHNHRVHPSLLFDTTLDTIAYKWYQDVLPARCRGIA